MKYKVGDKIKIKEKKFTKGFTSVLKKNNYILTIEAIPDMSITHYKTKEYEHYIHIQHIEKLIETTKEILDPILSRFEILDL